MKKFFTTIIALSIGLLAHATVNVDNVQVRFHKAAVKSASKLNIPTRGTEEETYILNAPLGKVTNYYRSANVLFPYDGAEIADKELGRSTDVIDAGDGHVYLSSMICLKLVRSPQWGGRWDLHMNISDMCGYLVGTRDKDNNIVLQFPQYLCLPYSGDSIPAKVAVFKKHKSPDTEEDIASYAIAGADSQKVVMKYDAATKGYSMLESTDSVPELLLGIDDGAGNWIGYGEFNQSLQTVADKPVTPPADAQKESWDFTGTVYENYAYVPKTRIAEVRRKGNDIYVKGVCRNIPDAWIKGTIDEQAGTVHFDDGQYLGVDNVLGYHNYLKLGERADNYIDEFYGSYESFSFNTSLTLAYDAKNHTITSKDSADCFIFNSAKDVMYNLDAARVPTLRQRPAYLNPTPAAPTMEYFFPVSDSDDGLLEFTYDMKNVDGFLIDTSKMYVNILTEDGKPYEFNTEYYPDLTSPVTNLPLSFQGLSADFNCSEGHYMVYLFDESLAKLGIQICNPGDDGKVYKSAIAWTDGTTITSIKAASLTSGIMHTDYYSLDGRKVSSAAHGVFIKVDTFANGTRKAAKIVR